MSKEEIKQLIKEAIESDDGNPIFDEELIEQEVEPQYWCKSCNWMGPKEDLELDETDDTPYCPECSSMHVVNIESPDVENNKNKNASKEDVGFGEDTFTCPICRENTLKYYTSAFGGKGAYCSNCDTEFNPEDVEKEYQEYQKNPWENKEEWLQKHIFSKKEALKKLLKEAIYPNDFRGYMSHHDEEDLLVNEYITEDEQSDYEHELRLDRDEDPEDFDDHPFGTCDTCGKTLSIDDSSKMCQECQDRKAGFASKKEAYTPSKLPEGAEILKQEGDVILAKWNKGGGIEFVTWLVTAPDIDSVVQGHYTNDLEEAIKDFRERVENTTHRFASKKELKSLIKSALQEVPVDVNVLDTKTNEDYSVCSDCGWEGPSYELEEGLGENYCPKCGSDNITYANIFSEVASKEAEEKFSLDEIWTSVKEEIGEARNLDKLKNKSLRGAEEEFDVADLENIFMNWRR